MLTVNLFDANFPTQPCSVWNQTSKYIEYVRGRMKWDGITLFTDEFINSPVVDEVDCQTKVGWLHEPQCLHPLTYERALQNAHKFETILTYYQPFLNAYPNLFTKTIYGGVWIPREHWGLKLKTKNISMLIGSKKSTEGHRMRHKVYEAVQAAGLGDQIDFYGVYGEPVDYSWQTKYKVLADYRYSIVIEACREDNLFTEILLDCFAVGTIPIFWGCPNWHKFFGSSAGYNFSSAEDLARFLSWGSGAALDNLRAWTPGFYSDPYKLMELADEYAVTEDWLYLNVLRQM